MVFPWWASSGCCGVEVLPWKIASSVALSDSMLPQGVWRLAHRGILNGATGVVYQNSMAWGTRVILSSISVEELDTWAGLLVLSAATLAYGDASGSFARWVSHRLSSLEQPTTTTLSFQSPLHTPSWVILVEVLQSCSRV